MRRNAYKPGDWVVYRKTKHSTAPGPRAHAVSPSESGDTYSYVVDKYWVVTDVAPDGEVVLCTRRGKERHVNASDRNLRRATWWERLRFNERFRAVEQTVEEVAD